MRYAVVKNGYLIKFFKTQLEAAEFALRCPVWDVIEIHKASR